MDALRWENRPQLHEPVMIAAFEGWTDAAGAATSAAAYLSKRWRARTFADIDAEEFYDFTVRRPQVRLDAQLAREIVWPLNQFWATSVPDSRDLVILVGIEPHLRWRSFCDCVTAVATQVGVQAVFTLGAMLADVAHTRPTPLRVSTTDPKLAERLGWQRPQYQGPTGIVGVLHDALAKAAIPVGSVMAQVPHYISATPSPKATLAIVDQVCELLSTRTSTTDLQRAAAKYEHQVNEVVAADNDIAQYVRELEQRADQDDEPVQLDDLPSGDALAAQLEQFLREQDGQS